MPASGTARKGPTEEAIPAPVPVVRVIPKETLRSRANGAGVAWGRINPLIAELVGEGTLHHGTVKRSGTNGLVMLSRTPRTTEELAP